MSSVCVRQQQLTSKVASPPARPPAGTPAALANVDISHGAHAPAAIPHAPTPPANTPTIAAQQTALTLRFFSLTTFQDYIF